MSSIQNPRRAVALSVSVLVLIATALVLLLGSGDGDDDSVAKASHGTASAVDRGQCSVTVSSLDALQSAASSASAGEAVCLTNGRYEELELDLDAPRPGVTVRAANPGRATLDGASLSGVGITLARFVVREEITVEPGARRISVVHNRISGGYFGVDAGPTTSTSISDTTIRDNLFAGPFGEDAIRLNRYHDSSDPDPFGILIEGNEFTGIRENGNHSDCLQSVWGGDSLYFRRNYLHDNRCQGFFVKDQPEAVSRIVIQNNLMLRNAAPCEPPESDCGPPSIVQIFGPTRGIKITQNTIWTDGNRSPLTFREGPFGRIVIKDNVIYRIWSDWSDGFPNFVEADNTLCEWEGTLPRKSPKSNRDCSPGFANPVADDYRVRSGRGVTWSPANQHYGP